MRTEKSNHVGQHGVRASEDFRDDYRLSIPHTLMHCCQCFHHAKCRPILTTAVLPHQETPTIACLCILRIFSINTLQLQADNIDRSNESTRTLCTLNGWAPTHDQSTRRLPTDNSTTLTRNSPMLETSYPPPVN